MRLMTTPHYDVAIATPGHSMKAEYVKSLVLTCNALDKLGKSYIFLNKYSSFVPSARELTATDTYSHNWETRVIGSGAFSCRKIFWIDSDIVSPKLDQLLGAIHLAQIICFQSLNDKCEVQLEGHLCHILHT